eukprot:TRINITY_DN5344_c0_g1_i2.p1 TRINITY_DN5344_c0_g1~~TRINITY_DN5344_c0_g1_i2.p1  ORF type:complete len:419 (-),score=31.35 TRINITY_DN5344_c0_g1_i2:184-1344(-)
MQNLVLLLTIGLLLAFLFQIIKELPYPASRPTEAIPAQKYAQHLKMSPLKGKYQPNSILHNATILFKGQIQRPESVALSFADGKEQSLYLLDQYGNIFQSNDLEVLSYMGYIGPGRPLGVQVDSNGDLIICDSLKGLIKVARNTSEILILANQVADMQGQMHKNIFANDLDISSDGIVYFTSSSDIPVAYDTDRKAYDDLWIFFLTVFHGKPAGALAKFDTKTHSMETLVDDIWFANGVALSKNEDFVAVVETATATVYKHFVKGAKKGKTEVLIDGLPGFPDGITRDPDGTFWIAIVARQFFIHIPYNRWVRAFLAHMWWLLEPFIRKFGLLLNVDEDGNVLHVAMDVDGSHVYSVSGAVVGEKGVYMGCLNCDYVSYIDKIYMK